MKNKMVFVGILSQIKLLFGPLFVQPVWYILKQLLTNMFVEHKALPCISLLPTTIIIILPNRLLSYLNLKYSTYQQFDLVGVLALCDSRRTEIKPG